MAKIENVQFIIPVTGQSYTDVRPTISGKDWEDIKQTAGEVAESVGNTKLSSLLSGKEKAHTEPVSHQSERFEMRGDGVRFYPDEHKYFKDGKELLSGSQFAHYFQKDFPMETIAKKVAEKDGRNPNDIVEGWNMKGQVSLDFGSLIHKAMELYIKFGELPTNEYLANIVKDWAEQVNVKNYKSEVFVHKGDFCGVVDIMTGDTIEDFKTGDIYKKVKLIPELKELGFKEEMFTIYTLQLNFYRMISKGDLFIWHLVGEHWKQVSVPRIDDKTMEALLEKVWK